MRDKFIFSDAQALSTLDSTGVVSTNVFDMELDASGGNTIITNDQVDAYLNVLVTAVPTTNAAAEGYDVQLRQGDNSDMTTGAIILASIHLEQGDIQATAGKKFSIRVNARIMSTKFLGVWHVATSTSMTTDAFSDVVAVSSAATGPSLVPVTVPVAVAVSEPPCPSETV